MKTIYIKEGFSTLYRGVVLTSCAGSFANSIFFYVYQDGKKRYNFDSSNPYSWKTILISQRAGIVSMFISCPLWTVRTRVALFQEYGSNLKRSDQILRHVVKEMWNEGIHSFYRGFVPSLFMSTYGVIQMYSYEVMTHTLGYESGINKKITWDNMLVPFIIGGTSKSLASATLIPINVVRMRLQMKRYSAEEVEKKGLRVTENTVNEI